MSNPTCGIFPWPCDAVSAWATCLELLVICIAAFFAWLQLREIAKARNRDSTLAILRIFDNPHLRRSRYFLFEHGPELFKDFPTEREEIDKLSNAEIWKLRGDLNDEIRQRSLEQGHKDPPIDINEIEWLLAYLNHVAFLLLEDPDEARIVVPRLMWTTFYRCWESAEPYIRYRRELRILKGDKRDVLYATELKKIVEKIDRTDGNIRPDSPMRKMQRREEALQAHLDRLIGHDNLESRIAALEQQLAELKNPPAKTSAATNP